MDWERLLALDAAFLAVSGAAALAYAALLRAEPGRSRMFFKTAATALLALFAVARGKALLLVPALGLGALGDAFLAWPGDEAFLRGLGSFLVAHLFYIALFMRIGAGTALMTSHGWRQGLATSMLALAPAMSLLLVPRVPPALRLPVMAYSTVILAMVLAALTVSSTQVVAGAVLFALSDTMLSTDEFLLAPDSALRPPLQHGVWALYYSGQLLIASGL